MSDNEEQLGLRFAALEARLSGKVAGLEAAVKAQQVLLIDTMALLAIRDPELVQKLLKTRRLMCQQAVIKRSASAEFEGKIVEQIEMAIKLAEAFSASEALGPKA